MKKAYAILEMLVVIAVIVMLSAPLADLSRTTLYQIPRSYRLANQYSSMLNFTRKLRTDIEFADNLPQTAQNYVTDANTLLIESNSQTICYQLNPNTVTRKNLTTQQDTTTWKIPDADIQWQILKNQNTPYALQLKTSLNFEERGRIQKKYANSYLCFFENKK